MCVCVCVCVCVCARARARTDSKGSCHGNQGSTCYLNSLMQHLFHTPEVRSVVFRWRYDAGALRVTINPKPHTFIPNP